MLRGKGLVRGGEELALPLLPGAREFAHGCRVGLAQALGGEDLGLDARGHDRVRHAVRRGDRALPRVARLAVHVEADPEHEVELEVQDDAEDARQVVDAQAVAVELDADGHAVAAALEPGVEPGNAGLRAVDEVGLDDVAHVPSRDRGRRRGAQGLRPRPRPAPRRDRAEQQRRAERGSRHQGAALLLRYQRLLLRVRIHEELLLVVRHAAL
mmetsp:Transcript_12450/g.36514  ORF Transcript_12450/g.36514 Transcript_12450/m.36514 type:complete len:212 (+) Transcript_12450:739-1374(+)